MKVYILIALGTILLCIVLFRKRLKPYFRFLFSKLFLLNLIAALTVAGFAFWGLLVYLDNYTLHDENIAVPNFHSLHIDDIDAFAKEHNLRYKISDSIYSENQLRGTVVKQDPIAHTEETESFVKPDRTIYLTVIRSGIEYKTMPKVIDLSKDFAISSLKINGLRYRIKPVAGEYRDLVYGAEFNGNQIKQGVQVTRNSEILLLIGKGVNGDPTGVPKLYCHTIDEARLALNGYSLFLDFQCSDCLTAADSLNAKIFKQVPGAVSVENSSIREGSDITVFASIGGNCDKNAVPDTSKVMSTNP